MISIKSSLVGLVLVGILALAPAAAYAHGGGGGGHGGGSGGHGGGGGGFGGGGGHFAGFAGHSFAGHSFAQQQGARFARHEDHFRHEGHFFFRDPFWYDDPSYGYDYANYGNVAGDYSDGQSSPAEITSSQQTIIAVQKELTQLGYYDSTIDGLIGPQTQEAIRWFQSVNKLPVTGQIDSPTLKELKIS